MFRCSLRQFALDLNLCVPLLVDPIGNPFNETLSPWPLRTYCLKGDQLRFVGQPRDGTYCLAEVRDAALGAVDEQ